MRSRFSKTWCAVRDWLGDLLPGDPVTLSDLNSRLPASSAGVIVSESSAEGLPVVFSCVRVISNAVAQLPLKLYRLNPDRKSKVEADDHPLASVLDRMANPEMTGFEFRQMMTASLLGWGNAYAKIDRNASGQVTALWPLYPWQMSVTRDDRRRLVFQYGNNKWLYDPALPPILRLQINSQDGIIGRSPIRVLREAMGGAIALQRFGTAFFGNGSQFGGLLTSVEEMDPEQEKELRADIERIHQGPSNAHKFLILAGGQFAYQQLGTNPDDAQFIESKKLSRSEICGAYGVPSHMVNDLERATFSNIENESIRWLRDGLEPYLKNFEEAISRDCLGPRSYEAFDVRFTRQAMLRGDLKTRSEALQILRTQGVISADEWRELEEMNPLPEGAGGDQYIVTSQSRPAGDAGSPATSTPAIANQPPDANKVRDLERKLSEARATIRRQAGDLAERNRRAPLRRVK